MENIKMNGGPVKTRDRQSPLKPNQGDVANNKKIK